MTEERNSEIETLEEEIQELKDKIQELENGDNEKEYIEFLNETQPPYKIGCLEFYAGDILKNLDEIAFNEILNNYNDSQITDLNDELEEKEEELKEAKVRKDEN
jgi:hypothetical protein